MAVVVTVVSANTDGREAGNPLCNALPDGTVEEGCEIGTGIVEEAPEIAVGAAGDALTGSLEQQFAETVGSTFEGLATFWVDVPSPVLGECTGDVCTTPGAVSGGGVGETYSPSDTVDFVWDQTGWLVGIVVLVSIVAAGIKLMWQQRGDAGRELVESLFRFVVVSSAGLGGVILLTEFSDALASGIINAAIDETSQGFGENFVQLAGIGVLAGGNLGLVAVIAFGLLAILAAAFQVVILIFRGALLILVVGFMPLAAAATNTQVGRNWWTKASGWILAFIIYKPVAALIYGAGFTLLSTPLFEDDQGPMRLLTGLAMIVMATLALPALVKLCVPATAAIGSAGGNAMGWLAAGGAGAAALATGSGPVAGTAAARAVMGRTAGRAAGAGAAGGGASGRTGGGVPGGGAAGGGRAGGAAAGGAAAIRAGGRHRHGTGASNAAAGGGAPAQAGAEPATDATTGSVAGSTSGSSSGAGGAPSGPAAGGGDQAASSGGGAGAAGSGAAGSGAAGAGAAGAAGAGATGAGSAALHGARAAGSAARSATEQAVGTDQPDEASSGGGGRGADPDGAQS